MGLSSLLVDTYRRYKRDTKLFTQWLGQTAQATGLVDDIFKTTGNKSSRNKKGRNGKHGKSPKQFGTHKVSVQSYLKLAEAVKDMDKTKVPCRILGVLKDVIAARKGCAAWYRAQQDGESIEAKQHNDGHQHIIDVFEQVYQTLYPLAEETVVNKTAKAPATTERINLFDLLEVEECPDLENEDNWVPVPTKKAVQDTYEPEASPEDVSFALYCFMKDMTEIRIFIRHTWREYKHKHITLNSAATTANTAIDAMQRLNEAFVQDYPDFAEHSSLIAYLYDGYVDPNMQGAEVTVDGDFASYEGEGVRLSSKSFFCDHTTTIVTQFYKSHILPMWRETQSSFAASENEKSLLQCLTHFNILDKFYTDLVKKMYGLTDDKILRAVHTMRVEQKFPTWAIFACQVFVDTQRELGSHVSDGFDDLKKQGRWLLRSWLKYYNIGHNDGMERYEEHVTSETDIQCQIVSLHMVVEGDLMQHMLDATFEKYPGVSAPYSFGSHFLFKNHPLLCGLLLQSNLAYNHMAGTYRTAHQRCVRTAIHLANAVDLAGFLPTSKIWADLEYIASKHGDAYVFVGERPDTLSDCARHVSLAFDTPASRYSKNKNNEPDCKYVKQGRSSPSLRKRRRPFHPRSRYVSAGHNQSGNHIFKTRALESPVVMMEAMIDGLKNSEDASTPANPNRKSTKKKTHFYTPLQALKIFKQALKEDDMPLRLDLLELNWRCVKLLRNLQKICLDESPMIYRSNWADDDSIDGIIGHVLEYVARGAEPYFTLSRFREACKLVNETILEEGNVEYLAAQARVGIVRGPRPVLQHTSEDLEDPAVNFVPAGFRCMMDEFSEEEVAQFKSRARGMEKVLNLTCIEPHEFAQWEREHSMGYALA